MMLRRQARIRQALYGLFIANPDWGWYVNDLWRATGASVGGIYVALAVMESRDWLEADWVGGPYPRRRHYRPTEHGIEQMRLALLNANWLGKDRKESA